MAGRINMPFFVETDGGKFINMNTIFYFDPSQCQISITNHLATRYDVYTVSNCDEFKKLLTSYNRHINNKFNNI